MKKRVLVISILVISLWGCNPLLLTKHEGFIVAKSEANDKFSITVVSDIKKDAITDSSKDNMVQLTSQTDGDKAKDAITFSVSEKEYKKAILKQKVVVTYNSSEMAESYPPQTTAKSIKFIE